MIDINIRSCFYNSDPVHAALRNINLKIKPGECILLCGKSGCGKSTLLSILNGRIPDLYEAEVNGQVYLCGEDILEMPMYEISCKIGSVFQNPRTQFYTVNTTSEIAFGCENRGIAPEEIKRRIKKAAKDLDIEFLLNRNIFQLSGGEKQRIAFAGIYAADPDIYILDEPSSNLDAESVEEMRKLILILKRQRKTIIIAEHRLYYLKDIADRVLYMQDGCIEHEYKVEELERLAYDLQYQMGVRSLDLSSFPFRQPVHSGKGLKLSVERLRFTYGKEQILNIDTCQFLSGRITAVIGKNGAGKSTLMSCICGLEKKMKGTVKIEGTVLPSKKRLRNSYEVMQEVNHQLFTDSVSEEIRLGTLCSESDVEYTARQLDIVKLLKEHPMTLSGGEKQRVIIASAMASDKKILIFDEPTSGLDFYHMIQFCNVLKKLKNEDTFIFVISHDYEFIVTSCDSVVEVDKKMVVQQYDLNVENLTKLKKRMLLSEKVFA